MAGNQGGLAGLLMIEGKLAENSEKKKEFCSEYSEKVITWNRQFWGCSGKSNYQQQIVLEYLPKKEYSKKGYYKFLKILGKFPKNNYKKKVL